MYESKNTHRNLQCRCPYKLRWPINYIVARLLAGHCSEDIWTSDAQCDHQRAHSMTREWQDRRKQKNPQTQTHREETQEMNDSIAGWMNCFIIVPCMQSMYKTPDSYSTISRWGNRETVTSIQETRTSILPSFPGFRNKISTSEKYQN